MNALLLGLALFFKGPAFNPTGPQLVVTMENGKSFIITTTTKGSPKTVAHILALVKKKFYDRQRVHRVEDWVTQWGAPASKTKEMTDEAVLDGGSGKDIRFEASPYDYKRGVVGIASEGRKKGGDSQLFILKKDALRLNGAYAVVGKVTQGMDVLDTVNRGDRIVSIRIRTSVYRWGSVENQ